MTGMYYPTFRKTLCLSAHDIAEIGGFSHRNANHILSLKAQVPNELCIALEQIRKDIATMTDDIVADAKKNIDQDGQARIPVFKNNADLREYFPHWPGRGKAKGAFAGPHQIAAIKAWNMLFDLGIDSLMFLHEGSRAMQGQVAQR